MKYYIIYSSVSQCIDGSGEEIHNCRFYFFNPNSNLHSYVVCWCFVLGSFYTVIDWLLGHVTIVFCADYMADMWETVIFCIAAVQS